MRILQVIALPARRARGGAGANGSERSTVLLCRGLRERGHEITVACGAEAPALELARAANLDAVALDAQSTSTLAQVRHLVKSARARRVQLLVAHDIRACRIARLASRVLRVPCVATMRGIYDVKNYRGATKIIAVAEGVREHVIAAGVTPERVVTVHNGVDVRQFAPPADVGRAKADLSLAPDALTIGIIARLSLEKGHDWFFQSVAPLAPAFPDARFLIVGDGPLRAELEARAEQLGLSEQTVFAGYQNEVARWMAALDVLVLPSIAKEGFARTLLEAGATGVPCIASPIGGNGEAIVDGETGSLVPTSDVDALTAALRNLLGDAALRARMGRAARARIEANFSVEAMVEKTEAVYRDLL